ncbi:MAG: hypothetical protein AABZ39_01965 [Spirochaetota bacterium]
MQHLTHFALIILAAASLMASGGGSSAPKSTPSSGSSGESKGSSSSSSSGPYIPKARTPAEQAEFDRLRPQFEFYYLKEVGPPRVIPNKGILFTYSERDTHAARTASHDTSASKKSGHDAHGHMPTAKHRKPDEKVVEVSGDFMNWEGAVPMIKGTNGIYFYLHEQPFKKERYVLKQGRYFYRYRVNGVWVNDPSQTNVDYDNAGQRVSYFSVAKDTRFLRTNPLYHDDDRNDRSVTFFMSNAAARTVYFTTDRHDFDPRRFTMTLADGVWSISFSEEDMPDGGYYYNFLVDGVWTLDPKNRNTFEDKQGRKHSFVLIARTVRPNE